MFEYFNSEGESVGKAYSLYRCNNVKLGHKHVPHVYRNEELFLGPYICGGYPAVALTAKDEARDEVPMRFTMIEDEEGLPAVRAVR